MRLHHRKAEFEELIGLTSEKYSLPASAVRKTILALLITQEHQCHQKWEKNNKC